MNLKNKQVTVIGAKRSGVALSKLILAQGGVPRVSDAALESTVGTDVLQWFKENRVPYEFGGHTRAFCSQGDFLVLSPGVRYDAEAVQWAKEKSIPVLGEIEFAAQFCDKPIIAVTGSNGKTTTVNLVHLVLQAQGLRSCLCGNVGDPFSAHVLESPNFDYFVLEISSFQMESLLPPVSSKESPSSTLVPLTRFQPHIIVFLNFSENHLDRHADLDEYWESKIKVFQNQDKNDFAILNAQDARLKRLAPQLKAAVRYFNDPMMIQNQNPNFDAVIRVAEVLGIPSKTYEQVFRDFKGVEHRLERVRTMNGVEFINDSKSTTAEAGRWALESMTKPVLMICGGKDKHIDYTSLRPLINKRVRKMFLIGETKEKMFSTFHDVVEIVQCQTLEDAVHQAWNEARPGECVLLSPMCASFDMFKDYEHRGRVFKSIVVNIPDKANAHHA